jgi:heavy metal translocating P-type ATPase
LIKNAESLEKLHKIDVVVVDKTGTITQGKPSVTDILISKDAGSRKEKELFTLLASLESNSEHPLAHAITTRAKVDNISLAKVKNFVMIAGKGITGTIDGIKYFAGNQQLLIDLHIESSEFNIEDLANQGKTPIYFGSESKILMVVAISDTIKSSSTQAVKDLHDLGVKVVMLTGDHKSTAEYMASKAGIDKVYAELLPQGKATVIASLKAEGQTVAMAGDGINDAPALAVSDVGIAMATGTDIAIEAADVTLISGDISKIPKAIKLSKTTMRVIKQNLFWAFIYNLIGIPIAAGLLFPIFGLTLNPMFAGLAMAMSSVSVVTNSLRLKLIKL